MPVVLPSVVPTHSPGFGQLCLLPHLRSLVLDSRDAVAFGYASSSVPKSAWESTCEAVAASVSANKKMVLVVLENPVNQSSGRSMLLPVSNLASFQRLYIA